MATSETESIIFPIRITFYLIAFVVICLVANASFFITSATVMPLNVLTAYEINSQIARFLWHLMQYIFESRHGAVITFSGDVIPERENAIVLANHVSYSDFYLINGLAARKRMLPYCRWFVKSSLMWQLPIFGLSMYLVGMVMVTRDWLKDSRSIAAAFKGLKEPVGVGKKVWLVSFLEGTRMTAHKLQQSQVYCQQRGKRVFQNVLTPRTKGFIAAVRELRGSQVTHLYDLTLVYRGPDGFGVAPTLLTINGLARLSPQYQFHIHTRRWALKSLPEDETELAEWIENVWAEKDQLLQGMKKEWNRWSGLVGWGSLPEGKSGACGIYGDPLWPEPPKNKKID